MMEIVNAVQIFAMKQRVIIVQQSYHRVQLQNPVPITRTVVPGAHINPPIATPQNVMIVHKDVTITKLVLEYVIDAPWAIRPTTPAPKRVHRAHKEKQQSRASAALVAPDILLIHPQILAYYVKMVNIKTLKTIQTRNVNHALGAKKVPRRRIK